MNDIRIHRDKKIFRDDKTVKRVCCLWYGLHLHASERYKSKLLFQFTREAANVISEASFTVMTGDCHDELAAMELSMIAVARKSSRFAYI